MRTATHRAARDLLLRRPPRTAGSRAPLRRAGESPLEAAMRLGLALAGGTLAIQGPPGSGKTYTAARMIVALVRAGRQGRRDREQPQGDRQRARQDRTRRRAKARVDGPDRPEAGAGRGPDLRGGAAARLRREVKRGAANGRGRRRRRHGLALVRERHAAAPSTCCSSTRPASSRSRTRSPSRRPAGRSCCSAIRSSSSSRSRAATRPAPSRARSATSSAATPVIRDELGLFLEDTWRLHPDVCAFTSEVFYEGRLASEPSLERQALAGVPAGQRHGHALAAGRARGRRNRIGGGGDA